MLCCPECFDDSFLRELAHEKSSATGRCDTCGREGVSLLEPADLAGYFEPILQMYVQDTTDQALSLPAVMRRDWGFFDSVDDATSAALLSEMFPDIPVETVSFVTKSDVDKTVLASWDVFREELKHENRFFPRRPFNRERDGEIFGYLTAAEGSIPGEFFRARVCESENPYDVAEMGAPLPRKSRDGRANPRGIPYLYVASDVETALFELRPHPSELVCVARFVVDEPLNLADLRDPRKTISPFRIDEHD